MSDQILVLNCGSSSIKFALFDAGVQPVPRKPVFGGQVEGIGAAQPYHAALDQVRASVERQTGRRLPAAIVHRVVHGGNKYTAPVRVDAEVLRELKSYIPLAPLHQPYALQAIEVLLTELPAVPQIACFDTAFHRTLPQVEQMLPLPHSYFERGIAHGGGDALQLAHGADLPL